MAADVQPPMPSRGPGGRLEGLSVVAGAANLVQRDGGNNVSAAMLRASYQNYPGIIPGPGELVPGQLPPFPRSMTMESYGPKLVQGDYTYHTVRRNLTLSSQILTGLLVPPAAAAQPSHRGTIPAMMPTSANITTAAAWKAYGSPSTRSRSKPPTVPAASHANSNPQVIGGMNSKLPRVTALGGGFRMPRPQSAPCGPTGELLPTEEAAPAPAVPPARRHGSAAGLAPGAAAASGGAVGTASVGLQVDLPDPLWAGRTDSGKVMYEHTLPTDPYSKYLWEEQARKARANMNRHIAAMAAAAAVNGGLAFGHGGLGGGATAAAAAASGSRPASARRGATTPSPSSPSSTSGGGVAAAGGQAMRPRFASSTIAELHRQGIDYRPQTVVGFAAPDLTEDATLPGPNDPRWAYTRLGRTQIDRLQHTLKMGSHTISPRRTASEPSVSVSPSGGHSPGGAGGSTISSPERSWAPHAEGSLPAPPSQQLPPPPLPPVSEQHSLTSYGIPSGVGSTAAVGRWPEPSARARSPSAGSASGAAPLSRPTSASLGRVGSASLAGNLSAGLLRPGSASMVRPGSATGGRPSSASLAPRPSSASRNGGGSLAAAAAALLAESSAAAATTPPPGLRGSSAGRSREAAPNPRVDLRAYLAEEQAAAEDEEDGDGGTEMLPVGDLYEALSGSALPLEVSHSMGMVPPEALAARLAEVVAAAAMVAAQQQMEEEQQAAVAAGGSQAPAPVMAPAEALEAAAAAATSGSGEAGSSAGSGGVSGSGGATDAGVDGVATVVPVAVAVAAQEGSWQRRGSGGSGGGADALERLHGASKFGRAPNGGRFSDDAFADYSQQAGGEGAAAEDGGGVAEAEGSAGGAPGDAGGEDSFEGRGVTVQQALGLGLGLGVGLSQRPGRGRPGSARPTSARPMSARPSSAMPSRKRSGSSSTSSRLSAALAAAAAGEGDLLAEEGGGMHVIHEQSETGAGEEVEV